MMKKSEFQQFSENQKDILIFQKRMETYHELPSLSGILEEYPYYTEEQLILELNRAIGRMNLSEEEKEISRLLYSRMNTIKNLMAWKQIDYDKVWEIQHKVEAQIPYYCYSEMEKEVLYCVVSPTEKGALEFRYTNQTLAELLDVDEELVEQSIRSVAAFSSGVGAFQKRRFLKLLKRETGYTVEEKEFMVTVGKTVFRSYRDREMKFYRKLAKKLIRNKTTRRGQIYQYCDRNRLSYYKMTLAIRQLDSSLLDPHSRRYLSRMGKRNVGIVESERKREAVSLRVDKRV